MGYFKNAEIDSDVQTIEPKQMAFIPRIVRNDPIEQEDIELLESYVKDEFTLPLLALNLLA